MVEDKKNLGFIISTIERQYIEKCPEEGTWKHQHGGTTYCMYVGNLECDYQKKVNKGCGSACSYEKKGE